MSPRRLTYEQKFEKYVITNLEKKFWESQNIVEEQRPPFDLQILDNEKSVNIKAIKLRENSSLDLKRRVEEMVY